MVSVRIERALAARIGPCGRTECLGRRMCVLMIDCRWLDGLIDFREAVECRGGLASFIGIG